MTRLVTPGTARENEPSPVVDADSDLVRHAQDGDYAAFSRIVEKYQSRIYSLTLRITGTPADAEEVTQGTFLAVIENLSGFRGESRFSTWLYRVAANRALKAVRARDRRKEKPAEEDGEESFAAVALPEYVAPWTADPEILAGREETREILGRALDGLDGKHRAVFLLRDVEGLSTEETALALGLSVANVKVRLMRARLMLREALTRAFGDSAAALAIHDHDH
ncbi:MAG: sigma-70 family RNA polymerase sigma factor [Deltaproteobacteria bacterium]|nr:sigma-70 family RNA polymerase sigma factor [Deltaproteobacteria bacterium]